MLRGAGERFDQAQPVDRMNKARVPDDGSALVRLQRTDEVPAQTAWIRVRRRDLGNLGGGFLIAVLAHIGDAKLGKQHDV